MAQAMKQIKAEAGTHLRNQWIDFISNSKGIATWTIKAIFPNFWSWLERPHGELNYFVTQFLTSHGEFSPFLFRIRKVESLDCTYCGNKAIDSVEHTLRFCSKWDRHRVLLLNEFSNDLELSAIIKRICENKKSWGVFVTFCTEVLKEKGLRPP
ncbi:uncharacterized protein [Cardiocondyla obscurior]|uniref:uncharacterized protein n=1 Tax=Cardiocondyla obscurior TaxID=286306 RepID=UPI0039656BC8